MVMTVGSVSVAMLNFFRTCSAHVGYLHVECQGLASKRVVAVEVHGIALDFEHCEDDALTLVVGGFELATDFHAGREL